MTDDPTDGLVLILPPPQPLARPPVNHVFGEAMLIPADISISGFDQKEKTCKNCGTVRVTIFSADVLSMRAWRRTSDGPQIATEIAPPCDQNAGWPR